MIHSKYEYERVDVTTIDGIKRAEKLHEQGWKIISSSLFSIQFERKRVR